MRGTTLTHPASRSSKRARATLSASSSLAHVLKTTILSVILKISGVCCASDVNIIFRAHHEMKAPLIRFAYVMVFLSAVTYAFFAFPKGMRAWQEKQRQVQEM